MPFCSFTSTPKSGPSKAPEEGFTLIELLVVFVIIAILVSIALPVFGNVRAQADSIKCTSNLHQISLGVGAYVLDHDNDLPGPLWSGQSPWYSKGDSGSMPVKLESYLNLKPNQPWGQRADVFVCPAYEKAVQIADAPVYYLCDIGDNQPWGYPVFNGAKAKAVMKMSQLASLTVDGQPVSLSSTVAMRDVDQKDFKPPKPDWWSKLPKLPVHKTHENALFYDWHIERVNPTTHLPM